MSETLEIADNVAARLPSLPEGVDRLEIGADPAGHFDEAGFLARLAEMPGRERIKSIYVSPRSNLARCGFLEYFPNATGLTLAGGKLVSTSGLALAPKLAALIVDTGKPNRMELAELSGSPVSQLRIHGAREQDLRTISACTQIRRLTVVSSGSVDLQLLASMQLDELVLVKAANAEIAGLDAINRIEKLSVSQCSRLVRFAEPNTKASTLWVESCNKLEPGSLATFPALKVLRVMQCKQPLDIGVLSQLHAIESVSFTNCKVSVDAIEKVRAPQLRKFWLSPAKDDVVDRISRALPSAMVCNGNVLEIGGVKQPSIQVFYE